MTPIVVVAILSTAAPIQERAYTIGQELSFSLGALPTDPFEKGWSLNVGYTVHWSETVAWELVNVTVVHLTPTALRDDLITKFGRTANDFAAPRALATTGLVISPLYGKLVFLDDVVVHHAVFAGLHAGVVFGSRETIADTIADVRPAAGIGIGYRVHLSEGVSARIDARDLLAFRRGAGNEPAGLDQVISISIGLSFSTRGDE